MLAVAGGYFASAGLVAGLSASLPLLGLARSEGVVLASMLGFAFYLVLLLWAVAARRLWVPGIGLALLAASGFGLARLVGPGG